MAKRGKLISCAIAAERLGYSTDYIRKLCQHGKIKAQKINTDWLMYEGDIKDIKRQRPKKEV